MVILKIWKCVSNYIYSGFVRKDRLLEGGRMEIEDSLYIMWTSMLKIREKWEFLKFITY